MRRGYEWVSNLALLVLLGLAVTGQIPWWQAVLPFFGLSALSSLAATVRRREAPAVRLSLTAPRVQQAGLRVVGWVAAVGGALLQVAPWWASLPVVLLVAVERGHAGMLGSDVLVYEDRLVTESESWFAEELPAEAVAEVDLVESAWTGTRRLVVVAEDGRRTALLPCREGTANADLVLAWAVERGIRTPTLVA